MKHNKKRWLEVLVYIIILALFSFFFQDIKFMVYEKFNISDAWETRYNLTVLIAQHVGIVLASSFIAVILGLVVGLFSVSYAGKEYKVMIEKLTYITQMIPTLALLNILVPIFGMGKEAAIVALVIFAVLPIYMGVVTGISEVPDDVIEVARGMGMNRREIFTQISFPIAFPVIIAGLRTALVINVSAATLAAKIGGGGLGILLLNAMKTGKTMTIIEGTIPVCLLAIIMDKILKNIEESFTVAKVK